MDGVSRPDCTYRPPPLSPGAHQAAGAGTGVRAILEDGCTGDKGCTVPIDPLNEPPAAGRQVVEAPPADAAAAGRSRSD